MSQTVNFFIWIWYRFVFQKAYTNWIEDSVTHKLLVDHGLWIWNYRNGIRIMSGWTVVIEKYVNLRKNISKEFLQLTDDLTMVLKDQVIQQNVELESSRINCFCCGKKNDAIGDVCLECIDDATPEFIKEDLYEGVWNDINQEVWEEERREREDYIKHLEMEDKLEIVYAMKQGDEFIIGVNPNMSEINCYGYCLSFPFYKVVYPSSDMAKYEIQVLDSDILVDYDILGPTVQKEIGDFVKDNLCLVNMMPEKLN